MRIVRDAKFKVDVCLIGQGEYHISTTNEIITTTLGSCISVCLYDPYAKVGGMNHYMLPTQTFDESEENMVFGKAKYGIISMELLINNLLTAGARRERLQSKVFGGANMFKNVNMENAVGVQNIAFAKRYLIAEGIPIVKDDVGGDHARKVYFDTKTGFVKLFRINNSQEQKALIENEKRYKVDVQKNQEKADDPKDRITFF